MTAPLPPKADLLGVGVSVGTPEGIADAVSQMIRDRDRTHTIAAVNVHTMMESRRSPRYREALNDASIAFVDGVPIRWILRASRVEPPPRIHGADLTRLLLERVPGARHLFFGSTPETLELLRQQLAQWYPTLDVAGFISPPFRKTAGPESAEMLERINTSGADILWVALGAPKQEMWALINRSALRVPVVACVGAVFEIFAGRFTRAPLWLQRVGLEWAWRLSQDPWRLWRRYFATNGAFAAHLLQTWIRNLSPSASKGRES